MGTGLESFAIIERCSYNMGLMSEIFLHHECRSKTLSRTFPGFHTSAVTGTLTLAFLVKTLSIGNIGIMGPGQLTNLAIVAGIES